MRADALRDLETAKQVATLLEKENERLHARNRELIEEVARLRGQDGQKQLELELARLQEQMALLQKKLFGASSEKRKSDSEAPPKREPPSGHGPRSQPELPIEPVTHTLDQADRVCATCGEPLVAWEGQTEDADEITVVERKFVIHRHQRQKYRCAHGCAPVTAPAPPKLIEGGRYSIDFAIYAVIAKYLDHIPLERQVRMYERAGLRIDSQTLWDQLWALYELVKPSHEALRGECFKSALLHADETPWYMLQKGPAQKWYAWSIACRDAVYYRIDPARTAEAAKAMLDGFEGTAMVDGFVSYRSLARASPKLLLAFCWAHVRRKFVEAEPVEPAAQGAIDLIGELYAIERELPDPYGLVGDDLNRVLLERTRVRRERAAPVVEQIREWALAQSARPESKFDEALKYMLGLWSGLVRFLDNPWVPLDNNFLERQIRDVVIGRKNHYGSKSLRGTQVAAAFYSLVETARLRGEDPAAYLKRAALAALAQPGTVTLPGSPQ